jgi:hypothetical protein
MPLVELLDGPLEWAGAEFESPEDMVAEEIGLTHPRWRGTPLGSQRTLYAYRKVETVGDRHRYRYQGPYGARRHRHRRGVEDLTGWDVLVLQGELESDDRRRFWGSPVRVYAAPPGTARPDSARAPEEQGWQELTEGGWLRGSNPGQGDFLQKALARRMAEGDPWVVEHWRRLAATQEGAAKDAEAVRIHEEHMLLIHLAKSARVLRRLRPDVVRSWTSDQPFAARTTYIPMMGQDLAAMPGIGHPEWVALQDRVMLVVHPELGEDAPVFGSARVYGAPPGTLPPDPSVAPERQDWVELAEGDFLIPWLLHIPRWDVVYR